MEKKIKYAQSNLPEDKEDKIKKCDDIDKNEYDTKYRGKLTCYKGCKAKIKFTERKNGLKFFSTWNKEGSLHKKSCPYYVNYKGRIGRKNLTDYFESISIDEDTIQRRLQDKLERFKYTYNPLDIVDPTNGSEIVDYSGTETEKVNQVGDENEEAEEGRERNIHYQDARYTTVDDIGSRLSIYGYINNCQLCQDDFGRVYAYFNLDTEDTAVSILFSEAFYSNEFLNDVNVFKDYITKVDQLVSKNPNEIFVIAYGDITKKIKDKSGVNVSVVSPKRILITDKTYKKLL